MLVWTIIMQWLHVILGIMWFGSSLYATFVLFPALANVPLGEQQKVGGILGQQTAKVIGPVAGGVVLLGFLRGTFFGSLHSLDTVFGTSYGLTWLVSLLLGIALILWGALIVGPKAQALAAASTPEEYGAIQQRLIFLARIELVGFLAIFTCMILMRFGY
ncbi:MAG TPA: hypothetical protein VH591_17105 [Ktedonobacterales bacterium]